MLDGLASFGRWLGSSGWGDLHGAISAIMAILGVPAAIWQSTRARGAAEAAHRSARDTRIRIARQLATVALSRLIAELDGLKELHRSEDWGRALGTYGRIRIELIALREEDLAVDTDGRKKLQRMIVFLSDIEERVERSHRQGQPALDVAGENAQLAKRVDDLRVTLHSLGRRGMEADDGVAEA